MELTVGKWLTWIRIETHNTHKNKLPWPIAGFESAIFAIEFKVFLYSITYFWTFWQLNKWEIPNTSRPLIGELLWNFQNLHCLVRYHKTWSISIPTLILNIMATYPHARITHLLQPTTQRVFRPTVKTWFVCNFDIIKYFDMFRMWGDVWPEILQTL